PTTRFSLQVPLTSSVSPGLSVSSACPIVLSWPHVKVCVPDSARPRDAPGERSVTATTTVKPFISVLQPGKRKPPAKTGTAWKRLELRHFRQSMTPERWKRVEELYHAARTR